MFNTIRRGIPNTITLLNLLSGAVAATIALTATPGDAQALRIAVALICLGAIFDFFDGFTARLLKVASPIGLQLDSLADLITFGFAPAALYILHLRSKVAAPLTAPDPSTLLIALCPLLLVAASAYRLARFNTDTRGLAHFRGLATPASAILTAGLLLGIYDPAPLRLFWAFGACPWAILLVVALQSILVVSDIPMFSLKIKHFSLRDLAPQLALLALAIPTLWLARLGGLFLIIIEYIALSLLFRRTIIRQH